METSRAMFVAMLALIVATPTVAADKTNATADTIAAAPAGKARIVVWRPSRLGGMALNIKVREGAGGPEVGDLHNGRYFIRDVDPGHHDYVTRSEATDLLGLEVAEGQTYYVRGTMKMGMMVGRPNLEPSTPEAFEESAPKRADSDSPAAP